MIVDPVIDGASGTFGVRLRLPNPDRVVPAGLRCQVRFLAAERPVADREMPAHVEEGEAAGVADPVVGPLAGY